MTAVVLGYLILISIDIYAFFLRFSLSIAIKKAYHTRKSHHIIKLLEFRQEYSAARRICNYLFGINENVMKQSLVYVTINFPRERN